MRPLLFVLGLTVLICSCQSAGLKQLTEIEGYIQEDHKKAYQELSEIKQDSKSTKEEKALYSLLWSMALDKNYIDVKSDSLIAPAVKYYSRHGIKQHRFLAYYYAGRVFENAGEYNDALTYYMKAEQSIDKTISKEYLVSYIRQNSACTTGSMLMIEQLSKHRRQGVFQRRWRIHSTI